MKSTRLNPFQVFRDQWAIMSFYERFEQVVALVLSAVIAVIIVVSLFQLISPSSSRCWFSMPSIPWITRYSRVCSA